MEEVLFAEGPVRLAITPLGGPEYGLPIRIAVTAGCYVGCLEGLLDDLAEFRAAIAAMHRTLSGTARLRTLDEALTLDLAMGARGAIAARLETRWSDGERAARLDIAFPLDQSFLPGMMAALDRLASAVQGEPGGR